MFGSSRQRAFWRGEMCVRVEMKPPGTGFLAGRNETISRVVVELAAPGVPPITWTQDQPTPPDAFQHHNLLQSPPRNGPPPPPLTSRQMLRLAFAGARQLWAEALAKRWAGV